MQCRLARLLLSFLATTLILQTTTANSSDQRVNGYRKKSGTTIIPHRRKHPNKSRLDNYGTKGMVNPHTGKMGAQDPFAAKTPRSSNGHP